MVGDGEVVISFQVFCELVSRKDVALVSLYKPEEPDRQLVKIVLSNIFPPEKESTNFSPTEKNITTF